MNKRDDGEKYLDKFPKFRKWINECYCCHRKGYNPDIPEQITRVEGSRGAYYIKKYYSPLQLDANGLCEHCALILNKKNI